MSIINSSLKIFILFFIFISLNISSIQGTWAQTPSNELSQLTENPEGMSSEEFNQRLKEMLDRTEKSVQLMRNQITESQSAPFLPELYLQLAELLSQKSNVLYYIQMERLKKTDTTVIADKELSPVVQAQQEAIQIYRIILRDFPKFKDRDQALFRMALALKSIDETVEFIRTSNELLSQYPHGEEAMRVRILLGQHYFDQGDFEESLKLLKPVENVKYTYEKNLARYRIGLIHIANEKWREALNSFEKVILDTSLKEQDNPYAISLKERKVKTDLKREALIDSIRAYTNVFTKNPQPIEYYSKLAPTEVLFQEVIEKLAVRYINLKKFDHAVKLLRTLSERTADPQKIVNIYQEVLVMIPIKNRIEIPVEEMRFVLEKYSLWFNTLEIPKTTQDASYRFFEKQIRDLGTTSHDLAKIEKYAERKAHLLLRARDFYYLYLGYFDRTSNAVKMATNLADVHFLLRDYLRAGDYYLRVFRGEFGRADEKHKKTLIENAIYCFQREGDFGFYENLRMRGLLIKAIALYQNYIPSKRSDEKLSFAALKAEYEQNFFPEVLEKLYAFMKRFLNSQKAIDAGELILDYYNTRNEFGPLETWADKLLALKVPNTAFNQKLVQVKKQARAKVVQEKVKTIAGFDDFAQGKSYLAAAMASGDSELADEVLKQALAKSKAEKDISTFLQAATLMAQKEPSYAKRATITKSVAREYSRITRFYDALQVYEGIIKSQQYPPKDRVSALDETINIALLLRDWQRLERYTQTGLVSQLPPNTQQRLREQLTDLLDSGAPISTQLVRLLNSMATREETLLVLYKAQYRLDQNTRQSVIQRTRANCGRESKQILCRWNQLPQVEFLVQKNSKQINRLPPTLEGIQASAPLFTGTTNLLQSLEGSGDAHLETWVSLKNFEAYQDFANYLTQAAQKNPDLRPVLMQKAKETESSARLYLDRCRQIGERSSLIGSGTKFCKLKKAPRQEELFLKRTIQVSQAPTQDPKSGPIEDYQKNIFSKKEDAESLLSLAKLYYDQNQTHHAAAAASYGASVFRDQEKEFRAILGCSVIRFGLYGEADYHLKNAESFDSLKERCEATLRGLRSR